MPMTDAELGPAVYSPLGRTDPALLRGLIEAREEVAARLRQRAKDGGHDVRGCSWHDTAPDHAVSSGRCQRCRRMAFATARDSGITWWGEVLERMCLA